MNQKVEPQPLTLAWSPGEIKVLRGALITPTPTPGLPDPISVLVQQSPPPPAITDVNKWVESIIESMGVGDSSTVQIACRSCRGPAPTSSDSQLHAIPVSGDLTPSFGFCGNLHACAHTHNGYMHTNR